MERSKKTPLVMAAACLLTLSTASFAEYAVAPDVVVRYSAQAAATPEGAAALLARLETAAAQVCAPARLVKRCQKHVTALAVSRLDQPQLNAAHAMKNQQQPVALAANAR